MRRLRECDGPEVPVDCGIRDYTIGLLAASGVRRPAASNARVVHAFVRRVRPKLVDDACSPRYILSERCVGFRMPRSGSG